MTIIHNEVDIKENSMQQIRENILRSLPKDENKRFFKISGILHNTIIISTCEVLSLLRCSLQLYWKTTPSLLYESLSFLKYCIAILLYIMWF